MFHQVVVNLVLLGLPAGLRVDYTAIISYGFVTADYTCSYSPITSMCGDRLCWSVQCINIEGRLFYVMGKLLLVCNSRHVYCLHGSTSMTAITVAVLLMIGGIQRNPRSQDS